MIKILLTSIVFCFAFISWGQYNRVEDVPDPKSIDDNNTVSKPEGDGRGYVSNPDGIISSADVSFINEALAQLEDEDTFQVAVVALNSIGSNVLEDFANDLFNHWQIGRADKDDGLLILFVNDQRRMRFETGDGMSTVLPDTRCYEIQQTSMVPFFKNENYSMGLKEGVRRVAIELRGKKVARFDNSGSDYEGYDEVEILKQAKARQSETNWKWIIGLTVWHGIGLTIFLIALLITRFKQDPYDKYNVIKYFHFVIWPILFPVTHIFVLILAGKLKQRYRDMIRFSGKTDEIMHKMNDTEEDTYLSKGQLSEEIVRSIDYDVWVTNEDEDILILAYKKMFSKYSKCPKCKFKTYYKVYDTTIKSPTYSSSGTGERKHECSNCKYVNKKTYRIPKLVRSSSASSSSSGWSSSSSSSSGGSSSWGGGSSSGGGASSSW